MPLRLRSPRPSPPPASPAGGGDAPEPASNSWPRWDESRPPAWVTAIGAWGDVFAACGNALELLRRTGGKQTGVIHYGRDPHIAEWLRLQPWCREAIQVAPSGEDAYLKLIRSSCNSPANAAEWLPKIIANTGISAEDVQFCHVDFTLQSKPVIHRWHDAALPKTAAEAAQRHLDGLRGPIYLLQPYSFQSCSLAKHWRHWKAALDWIEAETDGTYLLVGHGWDASAYPDTEKRRNLVGKTGNMMEVLALCEMVDGIVSTSNGLSMWSVMRGIPAVIALNMDIRNPEWYFHQWINTPPNTLIGYDASLREFQCAVKERLL